MGFKKSQSSLVILNLFMILNSVWSTCFIEKEATCKIVKSLGNNVYILGLQESRDSRVKMYKCEPEHCLSTVQFSSNELYGWLSPDGVGASCDNFHYDLFEDKMMLSQFPDTTFVTVLDMKAESKPTWEVVFFKVTVNGGVYPRATTFKLQFGQSTRLLMPRWAETHLNVAGKVNEFYFKYSEVINQHTIVSTLMISTKHVKYTDSEDWVLEIGDRIPERIRISLRKSNSEYRVVFGEMTAGKTLLSKGKNVFSFGSSSRAKAENKGQIHLKLD